MKADARLARVAAVALLAGMSPLSSGAELLTGTEVEAEVEAGVENGPLRGTMLLPAGRSGGPVVVIFPGSGPTDRDGNNPLGVTAAPYRLLAEALAAEGVASIRIDKRGMFGSTGAFADPNAVTFDDYAADALAWLEVAKEAAGADCAWLLGHSEGGLVALVAARGAPPPCGIVLVAAPGRKMGDVLREQLRADPANAPLLPDALAAIAALERGERVDVSGFHDALKPLFAPAVQGFLIDAFRRDPAALIAGLGLPALIVHGGNDLQVGAADAEALSRAQPSAGFLVLPQMNHVLKAVLAGDRAANLAAYADPALPLAPGLAAAIADFVKRPR